MLKFADSERLRKQRVSLWLIHEQKEINLTRSVVVTNSGAYTTYQGCTVYVRGVKGNIWHGNY